MRLIAYECKKLLGMKYLWVILIIMTALSAGLFYYQSGASGADQELSHARTDFVEKYNSDRGSISGKLSHYQEYLDGIKSIEDKYDTMKNELYEKADANGKQIDFSAISEIYAAQVDEQEAYTASYVNVFGYTRADGTVIPDENVYWAIENGEENTVLFRRTIESVINVAEGVMKRYGTIGASDAPVYEYESHFRDKYTSILENVEPDVYYEFGWMNVFDYDEIGIFICVYIILSSGVIFLYERSSGSLPIIRATRRGRVRTAAAKLTATSMLTIIAVLIFTLSVYVVNWATFGFSSPSTPVQSISAMNTCPYEVSVGEYALLILAVRCVGALMFSSVITLVSALIFSPVVTYITGAVILVSNLIVNFFLTSSDWILINLVSVTWAHGILRAYSEILMLGHYSSTVLTAIFIYLFVTVCALTGAVICGGRRSALPSAGIEQTLSVWWRGLTSRFSFADVGAARERRYPKSLFVWECSKLCTPLTLIAVAVLFVLAVREADGEYNARMASGELEYKTYYNEKFFGVYDNEMDARLRERRVELSLVMDLRDSMLDQYIDGVIDIETYYNYLDSYDDASAENTMLRRIGEHADYLYMLKYDKDVVGWLFYDVDLRHVLGRDINIFLFAAIVIVMSRAYAADYAGKVSEGNVAAIMRTTKRGRRNAFYARFLAVTAIAFSITVLFTVVDLAVGISSTGRFFEVLAAPVSSMETYSAFGNMTVGGYIAIMLVLRIAAYMILAYLTFAASFAVRNIPTTLFLVVLFTLLPYAIVYMGVLTLRYVDFTAMLAGGKLLTRSAEFMLGGGTYTFAIVIASSFAAMSCTAIFAVRGKTGK